MLWVDRAVEEAGEAEGEGAEEATIDLDEASAWRRSRRCNDKF